MAKTVDMFPKTPEVQGSRHHRCKQCGRSRGFLRKFELCRICFRLLSLRGDIPGVIKSSW